MSARSAPLTNWTLEIVATVHASGIHTNTAEVTQTGTYDTDSVPGSSEGDTFDAARSAPPGATTLYSANGTGTAFCSFFGNQYEDGSPSSLYELDPLNGDARKIADIKIGSTQALARFRPRRPSLERRSVRVHEQTGLR